MTATSFVRAAAAAGIALLVAGCNGSADGAGSSSTSSTPAPATSSTTSAAPSSTTTTTTTAPSSTSQSMAEKYPETPEGAEAFVRALFDAYNAASKDPSRADSLKVFYKPSCKPCAGMYTGVSSYGQRGIRQTNEAITILRARTEPNGDQQVVLTAVRQNAGELVDSSGVTKSEIPAVDRVARAVILGWTPNGWAVTDMKGYAGEI